MTDEEAKQTLAEARNLVRREGLLSVAANERVLDALAEAERAKRKSDRAVRAFIAASEEVAP